LSSKATAKGATKRGMNGSRTMVGNTGTTWQQGKALFHRMKLGAFKKIHGYNLLHNARLGGDSGGHSVAWLLGCVQTDPKLNGKADPKRIMTLMLPPETLCPRKEIFDALALIQGAEALEGGASEETPDSKWEVRAATDFEGVEKIFEVPEGGVSWELSRRRRSPRAIPSTARNGKSTKVRKGKTNHATSP